MLTGLELGAAIEAARIKKGVSKAALASAFGVKPPSIQDWIKRGTIDKEKLPGLWRYFADVVGPDHWGLDPWTETHPPSEGAQTGASVAQNMSHPQFKVAPKHIAWERLMTERLEGEFQTVVPDAAMAPDVPKGATIICLVGEAPEPGDFVLVADRHGHLGLREYRQLRPGHWEAHALNPAFLPLHSEADGLRVLAIFDGVRGRRARR